MTTITIPKSTLKWLASEPDFIEIDITGTRAVAVMARPDGTFYPVDICYWCKEIFAHENGQDISENFYEK